MLRQCPRISILAWENKCRFRVHIFFYDYFCFCWISLVLFGKGKKIQNGRLKKAEIFNEPKSQCFFAKISGIGPWVSSINWCDSTDMVVRPKTGKNFFWYFLPVLGIMLDSLKTISIEPHWCLLYQLILLTQRSILLNFAKKILIIDGFEKRFFLSQPFWNY